MEFAENPLRARVSTRVPVPPNVAFDHIAPIDLSRIFTGYGPLPAVVATDNQAGGWDAPGHSRRVRFSDGGSAREQLTDFQRPRSFAYQVDEFTGVLGRLSDQARGRWRFLPADGGTVIDWRYEFHPRSSLARPLLWVVVRVFWQAYMNRVLDRACRDLQPRRQ
ncbi:SRPBCC family protein [Alloalcanivorax mobilis]|uniref:SRPBCC family protein n=1 Tax=Alloalcanivorax mobilis TaxID=2019569 RepID=UPI000C790A33|nr:SRPBCC family protein [Alloalcanivorax mobilis]